MRKGSQSNLKCCGVVEEAAQRTLQRRAVRKQPQPWIVRKLMVGIAAAVMGYSVYVFVGRLCVDMIRRRDGAVGSRATGIALVAVFCILWLWMVWAYIKVVITSPGHARDHVPKTDRPPYPEPASFIPYDHTVESSRYPPPSRLSHCDSTTMPSHSHAHDTDIESIGGPSYENIPIRPSLNMSMSSPSPIAISKSSVDHALSPSSTHPTNSNDKSANGINGTKGGAPIPVPRNTESEHGYPKPKDRADYLRRRPTTMPILRPEHRYCQFDEIVKPYRSHHCRNCGTCILKYDHHCPWIGQCVGARNQKFFLNFVQAASVFTTYTCVTLIVFVVREATSTTNSIDPQKLVIIALSGLFVVFTLGMEFSHVGLIWHGLTTVESLQGKSMKRREQRAMNDVMGFWAFGAKRRKLRSYDEEWGRIGLEGNIWWLGNGKEEWVSVMGESVWGWFLPIGKSMNDGLTYPVNPRFDAQGVWRRRVEWPEELR